MPQAAHQYQSAEERRALCEHVRKQGWSLREAEKETGVSLASLSRWMREFPPASRAADEAGPTASGSTKGPNRAQAPTPAPQSGHYAGMETDRCIESAPLQRDEIPAGSPRSGKGVIYTHEHETPTARAARPLPGMSTRRCETTVSPEAGEPGSSPASDDQGVVKEALTRLAAQRAKAERKQGRPPAFNLNPEEIAKLRELALKKGSISLAIEHLPEESKCTPATRDAILGHLAKARARRRLPNWPRSLRNAAITTASEEDQFRGPKHAQAHEMVDRRGHWWTCPDTGARLPLEAGTLYESDDMSSNEPFSYVDAESGQRTVGRQTLCSMDVARCGWLAGQPIGRERDGYRLEDIADHIAGVIAAWGAPLVWRFERGPWDNSYINGVKLPCGSLWGGLDGDLAPDGTKRNRGIGMRVIRAWKSKQKGTIETSFRFLQSLTAHQSPTIGRTRGENEAATKVFLKAGRGDEDAAGRFPDIAAFADSLGKAMARFNARPKRRRAKGRDCIAPDDLLPENWTPREVPAAEAWRLLPIKARRVVTGGCVEIMLPHYPAPFRFRVSGSAPGLWVENGMAVLMAFHPRRLADGCQIFCGETTTGPKNRDGLKFGEWICTAELAEDAPQFHLASVPREDRALVARKESHAAMRASFRSIMPGHTAPLGLRVRRVVTDEAADGYGNGARVERGDAAKPAPAAPAAPAPARGGGAAMAPRNRGGAPAEEIDLDALDAEEAALQAELSSLYG